MAKQNPSQYRRTGAAQGSARRTPSTRRGGSQATRSNVEFGFPWTRQNLIGICIGVAVIVLGYILMGTGITADVPNNDGIWNKANAVTIAPILLTIGYCVIIPYFIFKRFKRDDETAEVTAE